MSARGVAQTSFLSPQEMRTLEAVCQTLVPSTPPIDGAGDAGARHSSREKLFPKVRLRHL